MRLEKIILDGFKSFADKTEFVFDASVTGIVGPNGCGKSNVVDAVKWVLGEQRLKSLRSDQMADVIFSGSGSRKPQASAEVTLVVSNPEGGGTARLPIEGDEVRISRRIYRNGESEYRINNKVCRLRDVRELFMDTGVGTRAYSIIEQGQIEQLVSASKADRRLVFEEAAGISKYKAHKKEALRKLDRTEQNLLRLADILGEVAKRLRSVKLQAGKARSYLEYTQRLKELQVNYSLVEYAKNDARLQDRRGVLGQAEQGYAELAAGVARADARMTELGNEIIDREHELSEAGNCLVAVRSRIEQQLQRIEFLRSRIEELEARKDSQQNDAESLRQQSVKLAQDLTRCRNEQGVCGRQLTSKREAIEQVEAALRDVNGRIASLQAELEDEKSGIIDIVRRTAQLHNEIRSISNHRESLSRSKERLAGKAQITKEELEKLLTEKAQCNARLGDVQKVLSQLRENIDAKRQQAEALDLQLAEDGQRLARGKEARSALNGELAALSDMEKRREGLRTAIKSILQGQADAERRLSYVEGILAEKIGTSVQYAAAVEAALEGQTDALLVNDTAALLADEALLEALEGRVQVICMDRLEPFVDHGDFSSESGVRGRLVEFVRYPSKYAAVVWKLLGKTLVVDSLDVAMRLAQTARGYRFVTLQGECLGADGLIRLGPLGKASGLISRRSRMEQLEETIAGIDAEIASVEQQIQQNAQAKQHVAKLQKDLRTAVYEANTEKTQIESKLALCEQNIGRLKNEAPLIATEIDQLEAQIGESVQAEYDSKQRLDELEAVNTERTQRIEQLEAEHADQRRAQESHVTELTNLKVELGQALEQGRSLEQMIESLEGQVEANRRSVEASEKEAQTCVSQMAQARSGILQCEATVSELFVEKETQQGRNTHLQEQIRDLVEQQKQTEDTLRSKRSEKEHVEHGINDLRVEIGQLEVRQQDLVERVQDELQINLAEAYKGKPDEEVDWEAIKDEINELRGKIERLGNVNVDAIEEQEGLEQRHEFLSSQVEDLNHSKAQLQQLIGRLNKTSREKFAETFEEIRVNFQQVFRKLFGGGRADIVLEDSEDILEAGIEVIAKPPGKETRSISLLSGGEKSMTALALLFAVFRTKPSPFCFLDEVDAALDEANNERFNLLIREFRDETQFIIITHAKRTMSIAEVLFGVTMQTQGVSKKISVRFDEYDPETAAA